MDSPIAARRATPADIDLVTTIIEHAFVNDPLWSRALTQHCAAYLESSNPANDGRYARLGFEPVGQFSYPGDGPVVTTMWREAR